MEIYTILALAIGLAMDAVAVSIMAGASVRRLTPLYALRLAALFGLFQGIMPVGGWIIGTGFHSVIASVDHWVAFLLLGLIGGRMIYHDLRPQPDEAVRGQTEPKSSSSLLVLAVATSIDAAAAGIGLIVLSSILTPALVIGFVTFILCTLGIFLGHRFRTVAGKQVNAVGGLILIAIGTKILIEHLSA